MNLKDLVPPLELCKLIPDGEFEDSVFVYVPYANGNDFKLFRRTYQLEASHNGILPAPTLKEILRATSPGETGVFCSHEGDGSWSIGDCEQDLYVRNGYEGKNPELLALRWWLKQKGIEDEK